MTDKAVERNRALLLSRSQVGLAKYGRPLHAFEGGEKEILQHALEEALDLANYLQTRILMIEGLIEND